MAKYSLDTVTVAEVLDNPELRSLVDSLIPAVLEHPLLEVGRSFIFNDAVPYIEDLVTEDELNAFREAVEALG
jgi:hypothetical protein